MEKTASKLTNDRSRIVLVIVCAVLLLALIVVSAFAYQWYGDRKSLRSQVLTLKSKESFANESIDTVGQQQMTIAQLTAENETLQAKVNEYTSILEENGLLPE